jgi:hypothetical protein
MTYRAIKSKLLENNSDIFTFRRMRRSIGYLGIALPIVLILFSFLDFFKTPHQISISHYYYTNLREVFTGTLCAVGLFLIRYKGYGNASVWKNDNFITNIAGVMAFGVALVPTNPIEEADKIYTLIPYHQPWLGLFHYGFAAVLFLCFSLLAINVFTLGQQTEILGRKSILNENNIYRFCGYAIILLVIMVPIGDKLELFNYSTLIFESLALLAFGIAWLIKGRALGDQGLTGQILYQENNTTNTEQINK